jgi:hypothetical protein
MVLIRRLEESGAELYQAGKVSGFKHIYIGQEAVSTGLIAARQPQDRVITAYRDHGVAINCGIPANQMIAELMSKSAGISNGRGGSMHMVDVSRNFWGGHAIVGAHLPLAAGLALGDKYASRDGVAVSVEDGLLTIVCRDADAKPLHQIVAEAKAMAVRAREGKVRPEDIEGSTFSISNLGMYDVENFIVIINPPEAAILAIGSAMEKALVDGGAVKTG